MACKLIDAAPAPLVALVRAGVAVHKGKLEPTSRAQPHFGAANHAIRSRQKFPIQRF